MMLYRSPSAKRTRLWSNSLAVRVFDLGALKAQHREDHTHVKTTIKIINKKGKAQFTGARALKASQSDT